MTGRRLYDHFCDALVGATSEYQRRQGMVGQLESSPKAWPVLTHGERKVWNDAARRLTPKRRAA